MHFSTNKTTVFFLYIYLISITLFYISSASETQCSPSENLKWNKNKKNCVECPSCHPGYFRNLTEPYTRRTGKHGAERCIRCKPCPSGWFSRNGYGECAKCVVNCTELDREFADSCTNLHDAKCGSCLNGFYDMFKNTQFPCAPKKSMRDLNPPKKSTSKPKEISDESRTTPAASQSDVKGSLKEDTENEIKDTPDMQPSKSSLKDHTNGKSDTGMAIVVAGVAAVVFAVVIVGFAIYRVLNRTRKTERRVATALNAQGTYTMVNDLSWDNDIEMDTFAQTDETGTTRYHQVPRTEPAAVRSELEPSVQLYHPSVPRAELSHMSKTNNFDGLIYVQLPGVPSDVFCYERHKDICRCRVDKQCQCQSFDFLEDIYIDKSDRYVLEVASNVCHDPFPLFHNLGLENPIIYQENNSRDRDPRTISQKELVLNLLHRWLEVKPTSTTLKHLSIALCKADFHNINNKLHELYNKSVFSV